MDITRSLPTTALQMVTMARNGSRGEYLLVRALFSTGRITSTGMSITISTIGRATADLCQRAAGPQRQPGGSSTARPCTTLVDVRLEVDAARERNRKCTIRISALV